MRDEVVLWGRGQILLIFVGHDKDSKCKRESIVDFKQDVPCSDLHFGLGAVWKFNCKVVRKELGQRLGICALSRCEDQSEIDSSSLMHRQQVRFYCGSLIRHGWCGLG